MSKTVNGVDGVDATLSDSTYSGQFPSETVASVFAEGLAALNEAREAMQARPLTWTPGGWVVDATDAGLEKLENRASRQVRLQIGYKRFGTDTASFTGEIAGTTLTASAVTGYLYPGVFFTGGTTAADTYIKRQITGEPGGAGTYEVSSSQTVSSASMTSSGYHEGLWVHGDGVGLYMEKSDGTPTSAPEDADNILDASNDAAGYVRALWDAWNSLYGDLDAARNTVGTDQNKIDAMRVVIDTFDDAASWPDTNIPL